MPIVSMAEFNTGDDDGGQGGQPSGESLPPYGPGGIYHEKQIGALCAVHAMNNLMQYHKWDPYQLAETARALDRKEAQLLGGNALDQMGNVRADGFFNVEVIKAALMDEGFVMDRIAGDHAKQLLAQPEKQRGFILNKKEHWFTLRRIQQEWFDLNSCLRTPRHFTDRELASTVNEAFSEGYTVFAVNGPFPSCELEKDHKKLLEAVQGCGRFRQGHCLFAGEGQTLGGTPGRAGGSSALSAAPTIDPELLKMAENDPELAAAIAASIQDHAIAAAAPEAAPAAPAKDDMDEIRRKRLARFG